MRNEEIVQKYAILNSKLKMALSTMEKKEELKSIRTEIENLRNECSHEARLKDGRCAFCGKQF